MKPLAKVKKQGWKAMGSAFGQMKSAVDPMKSFSKIMEVLNVLMLPLTYIFTLLAAIILNKLMPYISDLITYIDELSLALEEQAWWNKSGIDFIQEDAIPALIAWYNALHIWFLGWDQRLADFLTAWDEGMEDLYGWVVDLFENIGALFPGGGGGAGGGGDGGYSFPFPPIMPPPMPPGSPPIISGTSSTYLSIDLSNSIIDNRDKLVRDIVEQVIIRLG